ncbi:hypothetical protein [Streptomyces sp. NPDC090093]|uniref:hypothetical protein n=2 Tax=unclassified Streptomyces TaxID=2593676 RepID=UPI0038003B7A
MEENSGEAGSCEDLDLCMRDLSALETRLKKAPDEGSTKEILNEFGTTLKALREHYGLDFPPHGTVSNDGC